MEKILRFCKYKDLLILKLNVFLTFIIKVHMTQEKFHQYLKILQKRISFFNFVLFA